MKNLLFIILFAVCISMVSSCGNKTANPSPQTSRILNRRLRERSGKKSPVRTYSTIENGKPIQLYLKKMVPVLKTTQGTENRPFTWKTKDGGIFFKYDGEAQEWQLPVDIAKGEIAYGYLSYTKKE